LVDKRTQAINRRIQAINRTGMTGVVDDVAFGGWVAIWNDANSNQCTKFFSKNKYGDAQAHALAIESQQRMIRELPHYAVALELVAVKAFLLGGANLYQIHRA